MISPIENDLLDGFILSDAQIKNIRYDSVLGVTSFDIVEDDGVDVIRVEGINLKLKLITKDSKNDE